MHHSNFSLWEVENQSQVKRFDICDETDHYGYEPQATIGLKDPGRFSKNHLVATLHGKHALHQFKEGDIVAVQLRFSKYKKHGDWVNHISVDDIRLVKDLDYLFL